MRSACIQLRRVTTPASAAIADGEFRWPSRTTPPVYVCGQAAIYLDLTLHFLGPRRRYLAPAAAQRILLGLRAQKTVQRAAVSALQRPA